MRCGRDFPSAVLHREPVTLLLVECRLENKRRQAHQGRPINVTQRVSLRKAPKNRKHVGARFLTHLLGLKLPAITLAHG